jgi:protein-disulfide isomerase
VAILGISLAGTAYAAADFEEILGERALGSPDAPVTIEEHSSLTCGHCGTFHQETLPKIKKDYIETGKVRLVFRDFPFDQLGLYAAMIPHCAPPERSFGYLEVLFRSQSTWMRSADPVKALSQVTRLGGMSDADFKACLGREDLFNAIRDRTLSDGKRLGIDATPTFFINGEMISGNMPYEDFKEMIDRALEKAN